MAGSAKQFGKMLTQALEMTKAQTGDSLTEIELEIGQRLGYKGRDTIEKWKAGKSLPKPSKLDLLTKKLIENTTFDRKWFDKFLTYADYPNKSKERLLDELFSQVADEPIAAPLPQLPIVRPEKPPYSNGSLVGREKELFVLQQQIKTNHFAILTGMPGIGKSALAGALVEREARPPDRLFWYTLRGQEGLDDIIYRLASFLAHHGQPVFLQLLQQGNRQPNSLLLEQILLTLSQKSYLLCFDDFHRLDDRALSHQILKPLLEGAKHGDFDLLIISRKMLQGVEMSSFTVEGLDEAGTTALLSQLNQSPSDDMRTMLHQLSDGNPQLLILATNILGKKQNLGNLFKRIAEEIDIEKFIMAEVDENLDEDERDVMQAISICLDYPASYLLIEEILDRGNLRKAVHSLCDRHLLLVHTDAEESSLSQYSQHAIVQQFYYGQIRRARRQAMHNRAAIYYSADEQDFFKAALHYEKAGKFEFASQYLVGDYAQALIQQGQSIAASELLSRLQGKLLTHSDIQIDIYQSLGAFYRIQGAYESAIAAFTAALERARSTEEHIDFLYELTRTHRYQGAFDQALKIVEQTIALYTQNPALPTDPKVLNGIGWVYSRLGNVEEMARYFQKTVAFSIDGGKLEPSIAADTALGLGTIAYFRGQFDTAEEYFRESQGHFKEIGNIMGQAQCLNNLGLIYQNQQKYEDALDSLEAMLVIFESTGAIHSQIIGAYNIAVTYLLQKNYVATESYLTESIPLAERTQNYPMLCRLWAMSAEVALQQNHLEQAKVYLDKAKQWLQKAEYPAEQGIVYYLSGAISLAENDYQQALEWIDQADPLLENSQEMDYLAFAQSVRQQALRGLSL